MGYRARAIISRVMHTFGARCRCWSIRQKVEYKCRRANRRFLLGRNRILGSTGFQRYSKTHTHTHASPPHPPPPPRRPTTMHGRRFAPSSLSAAVVANVKPIRAYGAGGAASLGRQELPRGTMEGDRSSPYGGKGGSGGRRVELALTWAARIRPAAAIAQGPDFPIC